MYLVNQNLKVHRIPKSYVGDIESPDFKRSRRKQLVEKVYNLGTFFDFSAWAESSNSQQHT